MSDEQEQPSSATPEELGQLLRKIREDYSTLQQLIREEILAGPTDKPSLKEKIESALETGTQAQQELATLRDQYFKAAAENEKPLAERLAAYASLVESTEANIKRSGEEIKAYRDELLGRDENDQHQPGTKDSIDEQARKLNELHSNIFQSQDPNQKPLSEQVGVFLKEFTEKKTEIEAIKEEIVAFQDELLGEFVDGHRENGIKAEVDEYVTKLKNLLETNAKAQKDLLDKIEGLLRGASTVALAESFNKHKLSYVSINKWWTGLFIGSLGLIMLLSIISFVKADNDLHKLLLHTVGNLGLIGASVWLAIYASKQRSQNKRLQEEYAFKEDVAKVYYGLKKEIEDLDDKGLSQTLNKKILEVIVDVVATNPSATLESKSHDDKGPVLHAFEKGLDTAKELIGKVKLPGS